MQRSIGRTESPPSPAVLKLVSAMLDDGPVDRSVFAGLADPEAAKAREAAAAALLANDWPNLTRYEAANAALIAASTRPDVVFMGDSITEAWPLAQPDFFGAHHVGRGISGQTTPQMLLRFTADVIALKPKTVHLLGGTNDVAGNTGPTTPERYQNNIRAMADLAVAHGVRIILGALPPAGAMTWRPGFDPKPWIAELNTWLRALATERKFAFADYHTPLKTDTDALRPEFSHDGVHPTRGGYAVMREVLTALL